MSKELLDAAKQHLLKEGIPSIFHGISKLSDEQGKGEILMSMLIHIAALSGWDIAIESDKDLDSTLEGLILGTEEYFERISAGGTKMTTYSITNESDRGDNSEKA